MVSNDPLCRLTALFLVASACGVARAADEGPDYTRDVVPILNKYCAGCHNAEEREGDLSLESFADLQKGGENGVAVLPGDANSSRLIRVLTGEAEPKMPPDDSEAPTQAELELLKAWIEAGAKGPDGAEPDRTMLRTPSISPAADLVPAVTALAWSPGGRLLAIGRFGRLELIDPDSRQPVRTIEGLPGKVNAVEFSADGSKLVTASGVSGLYGHAAIWNVADGTLVRAVQGHRDTLYAATLQPGGKLLATAGYDRRIELWNVKTGEIVRTLSGHNDAVYDLAFSPDGSVLASASGDETIKLWHVERGERLDTLGQPLAEQFVVAFSPDGRFIVAGGADNRIRVWRFLSKDRPRINPLVHARFAHEGAIVQLAFSRDGGSLISLAEDRTLKLFETRGFTQRRAYEDQPDIAAALAVCSVEDRLVVGRMDGSLQFYPVQGGKSAESTDVAVASPIDTDESRPMTTIDEQEPNDSPEQAQAIAVPATVRGAIYSAADDSDADYYRFTSRAGQQWMIETKAARNKSPLDSKVEVLDADGNRIVRVMLQAVRDSYFTFRGKDSDTSDDFRVHNWEEMELNEYLYSNGEVVKLWLYPRGPDSGFKVYPGEGKRFTYFDTSPLSHALGEPCYVVRPIDPGEPIIPNGLPVFPIYYENDDDGRRELGSDSRLTFTAPADGEYLVRVSDVRGFQGEDYKYELTVRPRRPDFQVTLHVNPSVGAGSGREIRVSAQRIDGFDGPIRVDLDGLPPGFEVTSPIVIEAGQTQAFGVIHARSDAPQPTPENAKVKVTASAEIRGQTVVKDINGLGEIKLAEAPKVRARIVPNDEQQTESLSDDELLELVVAPGETITARVRLERNGHEGNVSFGNADSGRNLPHGVYVDNIGLNGLLILQGQNERTFHITAANWVPDTTRLFHLKTDVEGGQATLPVILHVRNPDSVADVDRR